MYANVGSEYQYVDRDGFKSSDSQSSTTEEEILGLVHTHGGYYASPPSPVSSR
jgi:hypothetical protein